MISLAQLIAGGVAPTQARAFQPSLERALPFYGIDTPNRIAAFLGQTAHESGMFVHLEENLYYTTAARIGAMWPRLAPRAVSLTRNPQALANAAYAGKNGNGDETSGDGWRFIGRGLIQITGRANYRLVGREDQPYSLVTPDGAVNASAYWWQQRRLNDLADAQDWDGITRAVNGAAMAGAAKRTALTQAFLRTFAQSAKPAST